MTDAERYSIAVRHMTHAGQCSCLDESDKCCTLECPCHLEDYEIEWLGRVPIGFRTNAEVYDEFDWRRFPPVHHPPRYEDGVIPGEVVELRPHVDTEAVHREG